MSWEQTKLEDVCTIISGYAFKSKQFGKHGLPIIRIRDVMRGYSETFYDGEYSETYVVTNDDMLIGMDGDFNLAKWKGGRALLNQRVCKLIVNSDMVNKNYLFYFLPLALYKIWLSTPFVTVKHLSVKKINDIEIPLPPLAEQQKIAAILDAADSLRQKDQQLIEHYERLSQSLFLDMFGDPSNNKHNFDLVTIRELVDTVNYGTSAKAQEDGKYPYLRMNNITYQGYMDFESLKYIDLTEKDKPKYLVTKGDILFNRTNSKELVGKTGLYNLDKAMAIAGYLIRVRTNEKANPYYLWRFLNSSYCKTVLNHMCKSIVGMANINAQELQNIKILLPPIALQNQFAERIEQIEAQKAIAQKNLEKSQNLFNCLLQSAFKGELT